MGLPRERARQLVLAVRERWQGVELTEVAAERREELYARTMAVADTALEVARGLKDNSSHKAKYLNTALQAYDKAASLAGVSKVTLEVHHQHELRVRPAAEVLGEFGLGELKTLGQAAAVGLLEAQEVVVEAEGVEVVGEVVEAEGVEIFG